MLNKSDKDGHFENYAEYSKTLRAWLVAYGIGGPVLFLLNKDAPKKITDSTHLGLIVTLFVAGVAFQILLAFINKWASWHLYKGGVRTDHPTTRTYKAWNWINEQSWIDFLVDLGALVAFSVATWIVLNALLGTPAAA